MTMILMKFNNILKKKVLNKNSNLAPIFKTRTSLPSRDKMEKGIWEKLRINL